MITAALSTLLLMGSLPADEAPQTGGPDNTPRFGTSAGDFYPPIILPSLDGKRTYALSRFRGKKVLLVQFASW